MENKHEFSVLLKLTNHEKNNFSKYSQIFLGKLKIYLERGGESVVIIATTLVLWLVLRNKIKIWDMQMMTRTAIKNSYLP